MRVAADFMALYCEQVHVYASLHHPKAYLYIIPMGETAKEPIMPRVYTKGKIVNEDYD